MTRQPNVSSVVSGLLALPEGVVSICAEPITDDSAEAPIRGTLIAGRFPTPQRLEGIATLTLVPMSVFPAAGTTLPPDAAAARRRLASGERTVVEPVPGEDRVYGYSYRAGIDGSPAAIVRVDQPRTAVTLARQSVMQFALGLAAFVVVLLVVVAVAIDLVVLKRLRALNDDVAEVGRGGNASARLGMRGSDEIARVAGSVNEMLAELESSQSDLAYLATHDSLTRLYNRGRFETELDRVLLERGGSGGALLWFDLDHFKEVNDSLGHAAGDELLIGLANLLSEETRGYCFVARLGGDEFGVLIPRANESEAVGTATRLLDLVNGRAFAIAEHEVRTSASVGIVLFPTHGDTADDLLARADLAMYHAKSTGRNRLAVYTSDEEWRTEMTERVGLAAGIVTALREDRFVLYAQPTRRVSDGAPGPRELLLRMQDGDAFVMPDQIIPTAERIGLIRDIDRWVVRQAIRLIAAEQAAGRGTYFSVNLSGAAFSDPALLEIVHDEFDMSGAEPARLTIEITETPAISDIRRAQAFIAELKTIGCRFALDDFGAGASSFFYLKHLAIDDLKIDGSLIRNLSADSADAHLVRAIVEMCKGLGVRSVAEYVETEELFEAVRSHGVDYAQGYFVGCPVPVEVHPDAVTLDMKAVRTALRDELLKRGYDVASDSHGLKRDLYIVGDRDLARALFEFEDTVEEACESMYQGKWGESMPTRVAVLPLSQSAHSGLEMLEQIRIRTVFAARDHGGVVFRDLEAVLEGLS